MRAVAQRVSRASVTVDGETVGQMEDGVLALVGVAHEDREEDARLLAEKLVHLRILPDSEGRMNRSLLEAGEMLGVVSQFTLMGDCRKGRRPGWADAAPPEQAEPLIELLVSHARQLGAPVTTGRFRAKMSVELCNEGPVTLLLDTRKQF
ncbi:MAG: D-tyrosyl-tRNA(Tyr) deacylase [bacterium]|nr:D-tyrosyl-tRNA(Tyr) deacylase [bacterium]